MATAVFGRPAMTSTVDESGRGVPFAGAATGGSTVFPMLTSAEADLVQVARELIDRRPRREDHTVAAAALDSAGGVHTGLNVFHFTGGPCAELVVLGHAAAVSDHLPLNTIVAVLREGEGVMSPCGRCRQVLFDYFPDIHVIVKGKGGLESIPVTDLLPLAYDWRAHGDDGIASTVYFDPRYLEDVRSGVKTSTVRYQDPVRLGLATFVFEGEDGEDVLTAEVNDVDEKLVEELSDEDAVLDGFTNRAQLLAALDRHYPGLAPDATVSIVHFTLTNSRPVMP